jgi:hypothetical protein
MDREKVVFSSLGRAVEYELVDFPTWIPSAVGCPCLFAKLAAAGFAKLAAVANARRHRALESVAPLVALELVRFQLQQQQQQQQQQQLGLVKELRLRHRKVGRELVVLEWILNSSKCATVQLAVAVALNL